MSAAIEFATLWIACAAAIFGLMRGVVARSSAMTAAMIVGLAAALGLWLTFGRGLALGLVTPLPITLAVLGFVYVVRPFGVRARVWPAGELIGFLALSALLYLSAFGIIGFDLFALGYGPAYGAALCGIVIVYAWWRHDVPLGIAAFLAHLLWVSDVGADNVFNHLFGLPLVFVAIWALVERAAAQLAPGKAVSRD